MNDLVDFALKERYARVKKLRSRLEDVKDLLDWDKFLVLFPEKSSNMGRPAYDRVLMLKVLFLQSWHGLSDEEIEFQINDRFSFQQFLGFPKNVPDYTTVWNFRESLTEDGIAEDIWAELQRQLSEHNLKVEKGTIQDASFVQADPGKKNSGMEGRGREARTSRSKDGTWTKKNNKSYFGFKLHTKVRRGSKLIEEVAVTTASTHDNRIDLLKQDEIAYRDKAYFGAKTKAKGNATMNKAVRGHPLSIMDKLRNKRICKKRCQGEHPYGTMHRSFHAGRTKLTTTARVYIQQLFVCIAYNTHRLRFLLSKASLNPA